MLDNKGNMFLEEDDIIELMLLNKQAKILPKNSASFSLFEVTCKNYGIDSPFKLDTPVEGITWNMPENYRNIDVSEFIKNKHALNVQQWARVNLELAEFEKRNLTDLLRFLIYMVDILRSNNIVYGVGRGSSVASYVLFLIGIHRIDSYKFNLDIKEFLK
jgi:DNA polymerase III alpha subunit